MTDSTDPKTGLIIRNPDDMFDPAPLAFSHLAILPKTGQLVCVAGQGGGSPKGTFKEQTAQALDSLDTAMKAAGGDMKGIAKITVYIVDHNEKKHRILIEAVNRVFAPRLPPTCTIVPLTQLGTDPDMLIEIEALGVVPDLGRS